MGSYWQVAKLARHSRATTGTILMDLLLYLRVGNIAATVAAAAAAGKIVGLR